jgi:carboxyl-terminal processing protease
VRLTVARYFTPTGRCIQKPYGNGNEDYYADYYHRLLNGELESADSIRLPDSLKYTTPKGKTVYGGGGIVPDIFVPVERAGDLKYYTQLINKGLLYRFAFDYTDRHRTELDRYTTFEEYNRQFVISDELYHNAIDYAGKNGTSRDTGNHTLSDARARVMLKAYIGRNILDNEGFYPLLNSIDPVFLKGMDLLKEK